VGGPQVVGVALQEDLSVLHEERVVDEVLDVGNEVGGHDEQRGRVELAQDAVEDHVARRRVDAADGLVEQVHAGTPGHDEADLELLPHALAHLAEAAVGGQSEEVDHRGGLVGVEVGEERGIDADGIRSGPVGVQEVGIGQVGDDRLGGDAGRVPVDGHGSLVVGEDTGKDLEQRGLTAAVGAHEAHDVSGFETQVVVAQGGGRAVALRQAGDLDEAGAGRARACGLGGHESCPPGLQVRIPAFSDEAVGTFLVDAEGSACADEGVSRSARVLLAEGMQRRVVGSDVSSGRPLGDGESFVVEGGESSLDGVGVGAGLDGEVADGGDLLTGLPRAVGNAGAEAVGQLDPDGAGVIDAHRRVPPVFLY